MRVVLFDVPDRFVDLLTDVLAFRQVEQPVVASVGRQINNALGMIGARLVDARRSSTRFALTPALSRSRGRGGFSSSARRLANRASAKRRKMRPKTGVEYCAAVSPELARSWSAASQRRFSSVLVALRALTLSLTSTTMLPSLMTPILSSLNRKIFNVLSSRRNSAYLCDNARGDVNAPRRSFS